MERDDITIHEGKEYISTFEFAKRVGASERTIRRKVNDGLLKSISFDGRRLKYIEWEVGKKMWEFMPHDSKCTKAGKASAAKKKGDKYGSPSKDPKEPVVQTPTVPSADLDGDVINIETLDLSTFDKNVYKDCIGDDGEFDYDKLKLRLTAETYQQKLKKERGQLVEKTDIITWAKKIGIIVNNGLDSIPQRYTSVLIAQVQSIVSHRLGIDDFEFTEKERTELRTTLKACGPEIMRSVRLMVMEITEEEE